MMPVLIAFGWLFIDWEHEMGQQLPGLKLGVKILSQ
jgi:hypothetical protein